MGGSPGAGKLVERIQRFGRIHQRRPAAHLQAGRQNIGHVFAAGPGADQRLDVKADTRLVPVSDRDGVRFRLRRLPLIAMLPSFRFIRPSVCLATVLIRIGTFGLDPGQAGANLAGDRAATVAVSSSGARPAIRSAASWLAAGEVCMP